LVDATLPQGVMPAVVPQLKSITIGGAVSGIGIESSSFRYGLPHETVTEMEVLLGHGDVVTCRPDNEHSDLFFAIPNSYGTLGYILRLKAMAVPVKPYVRLQHLRFERPEDYFTALGEWCEREIDFLDGVVFGPGEHYLTIGRFGDNAPYTSDYTWLDIYYRSIRSREEDWLTVRDHLWRWDTDWFWCSKNLGMQNPLLRRLMGRKRLNSVTYTKIMRWNSRHGLTRRLNQLARRYPESVIQDVDIPLANAAAFLEFFQREVGIEPVWICPIGSYDPAHKFDLYPLGSSQRYVNFGFWDVVIHRERREPGHVNRKVERKVAELGGVKSLYSDAYYDEAAFWNIYNRDRYQALKRKYDPETKLKDLYQKVVFKQ
ncbi:MAG: FAD-binding oxidoreductase, partial [Pseudomonadota bacterium]|nr:FAD-binding oxidoreductase [Pseudomonadota bacterium]